MAGQVEPGDVVVCHHVLYNVANVVPFVEALSEHARRRVVIEITERHPRVVHAPLWRAIHGIERPSGPTASDAAAVLAEMGLHFGQEEHERPSPWREEDRSERVAMVRRALCVGPERDAEIDALIGPDLSTTWQRRAVTLWWDVSG